jgi:xylose isomerase
VTLETKLMQAQLAADSTVAAAYGAANVTLAQAWATGNITEKTSAAEALAYGQIATELGMTNKTQVLQYVLWDLVGGGGVAATGKSSPADRTVLYGLDQAAYVGGIRHPAL